MTQHTLMGRQPAELLWTQRRQTLQAAAAWVALSSLPAAVSAQPARGNVVEFVGDVLLNGQRLLAQQAVQTGDEIQTGPDSRLVFVLGNAAFHVRQNSRLSVGRGATINTVSLLRLLTGAVVSVFGRGGSRSIVTPTLTAGIRGTGVYTEVMPDQNTYFCNCYGTVDLTANGERVRSISQYHQSFWSAGQPTESRFLMPAPALNHTDEELEFLARLINQRTAWQISGKKGVKDGKGFMEERPDRLHPAMMPPVR
jgi:hypothetical protein